jgi:hypothetical protein
VIIDQLVLSLFLVACLATWGLAAMIVLADKVITFSIVYLFLFSLPEYNDLHLAFKFMFGSKDLMVFSVLLLVGASNWLKIAYLISGIINLLTYASFYVFDYVTYSSVYGSFAYIVQFISASQLIGILADDRHYDDDGGKFFLSGFLGRSGLQACNVRAQEKRI